jgi:hypothetical protein
VTKPFFAGAPLSDYIAQQMQGMKREIDTIDGNNLLSFVPATLAKGIAQRYTLAPIVIADAAKRADVRETRVDARMFANRVVFDESRPVCVDGTKVTLSLPFTGTVDLLSLQPGTWDGSHPQGAVAGNELIFERAWLDTPAGPEVEAWVSQTIGDLRKHTGWQEQQIRSHNESLETAAIQAINSRRSSLLAKRNLQASLPFNMTMRPDAPLTFAPEGIRRKTAWSLPQEIGRKPFEPEASLSPDQFEDILRTLRAIGHSMERTSGTFTKLEEEEIRSVFLAALNAQFEGGATGETFNAVGKTDILIRYQDRNLFIGECKVWQGPVGLSEAIDQVLGYLCWRDSHAAILLFVRNKDMSAVVEKIPSTIAAHGNHIRLVKRVSDTEWHYKFMQKDDSARELALVFQAYHLRP